MHLASSKGLTSPKTTVISHVVVPDVLPLRCLPFVHLASRLAGQRAGRGVLSPLVHIDAASRHHDATAV